MVKQLNLDILEKQQPRFSLAIWRGDEYSRTVVLIGVRILERLETSMELNGWWIMTQDGTNK